MLKHHFLTVIYLAGLTFVSATHAELDSGAATFGGDNQPANARFVHMPSTDAGSSVETIYAAQQNLNSQVVINIDPAHVGKSADILIVARYQNNWYMRTADGGWLAWDANPNSLVVASRVAALKSTEQVLVAQLRNLPGQYELFVGYKVDNKIVFNARALSFNVVTGKLNDTGINFCANTSTNRDPDKKDAAGVQLLLNCQDPRVKDFTGQDALQGRDATNNNNSDGQAGFSFTKIGESGEVLPVDATTWACIRDNVTGLLWENKTGSITSTSSAFSRLHSWDNTYTWYNPDPKTNGGKIGVINGGGCTESTCDTDGFVRKNNEIGLCGFKDGWRLPTKVELLAIVDNSRFAPAIDQNFFPFTYSLDFWSSSPMANGNNDAWSVEFYYGGIRYTSNKGNRYRVRLVRG